MTLLKALLCQKDPQTPPPVWLMRQAGRYLPSYRELRKGYSLQEMFHDPKLIEQVTLLPFEELSLDAAILFADILHILEPFGVKVDFIDGKGPVINHPPYLPPAHSIDIPTYFTYQTTAIAAINKKIDVPLLGFAGAPFTVASYLIEQGSSKELHTTKKMLYQQPKEFSQLIDTLTEATITYLMEQIKAGVKAVQLFDSWAHTLSYTAHQEWSVKPCQKIAAAIRPHVPVILFARGMSQWYPEYATTGANALSLDWQGDLPSVRQKIGPQICLQGNFDPCLLYAPTSVIEKEVTSLCKRMQNDPGYICNLGHGILPDTPLEGVKALIRACKSSY